MGDFFFLKMKLFNFLIVAAAVAYAKDKGNKGNKGNKKPGNKPSKPQKPGKVDCPITYASCDDRAEKPPKENAKACKKAFLTCIEEFSCPAPGKPQKPEKCNLSDITDCAGCLAAPASCTGDKKAVAKFLGKCAPLGYIPGSKAAKTVATCGEVPDCSAPAVADCDEVAASCSPNNVCFLTPNKAYANACKKAAKELKCGKPEKPEKPKGNCPAEPDCKACKKAGK